MAKTNIPETADTKRSVEFEQILAEPPRGNQARKEQYLITVIIMVRGRLSTSLSNDCRTSRDICSCRSEQVRAQLPLINERRACS